MHKLVYLFFIFQQTYSADLTNQTQSKIDQKEKYNLIIFRRTGAFILFHCGMVVDLCIAQHVVNFKIIHNGEACGC